MPRFATVIFLLLSFTCVIFSQELSLDKTHVTLKLKDRSLREAITKIKKQTKIQFVYNDALIENEKVSCNCENVTLRIALYELFKNIDINYQFVNDRK